jgi:hypothetical protein
VWHPIFLATVTSCLLGCWPMSFYVHRLGPHQRLADHNLLPARYAKVGQAVCNVLAPLA